MLVFAHRGLHHDVPENTIAAFAAAVAAGVDGIETDVRLTRDHVPVLFHDPKVRRRPVSRMTRLELSRAAGYEVPSLAEAMARFDVIWNVEIKSRDAARPTFRVLRRFEETRRFFVTSFRRDIVTNARKLLDAECGMIFERAKLLVRPAPGTIRVWRFHLANKGRLRRAHKAGRKVHVYGMRTRAQHDRVVRLGVDGVITDFPDLVR